jgi:hypothetical protein
MEETKMRIRKLASAPLFAVAMLLSAAAPASPPAQSGVVTREDVPDAGFIVDHKAGLLTVVGIDPVEFCMGMGDFDLLTFMTVDVQSDPERIALFAKGEMRASVWDFVEFNCDLFEVAQPLATGMAMIQSTDNDFNIASTPNSNAYGFSARGMLIATDTGKRMHLNAVYRAIWDKDAGEALVKNSKVTLR